MNPRATPSLGDRVGDLVQWSVGAFVVLGILVGLLQAVGVTWERAPGGVLLGVLFWALLLIGVRAVVRTSSSS